MQKVLIMWEQSSFWSQYQMARVKGWCLSKSMLKLSQQLKLKRLLRHIHTQIPFYRDLDNLSFGQLPMMDKSLMREHFSRLNTQQLTIEKALLNKDAWHVNQSLGTAGKPSIYLYSPQEIRLEMINILSRLFPPCGFSTKKIAVFYLSCAPYFIAHGTCFKWCFIDLQRPLSEQLDILRDFSPDLIIAPVQILAMLATAQHEKKLSLSAKGIVATQEVLTPVEEKLISTTFAQNVQQLYQCGEGQLGFTCDFGTLHLNETQYYIEQEWVDETNERFIPVITTLNRFLQPLVRYRMEDILSIKTTACPCGSPLMAIERIVGRCEDTLYFSCPNHHLKPIYSDHFHSMINRSVGSIQKYQLLQHSPSQLEIKLNAKNMVLAKHSISQQFEKLSRQFGVMCPRLVFSVLENPPLSEMFRQTKRLVKMPL